MKKLGLLVMPLTATLFLASCGSKPVDPSKIDLYKKEITYDETGKIVTGIDEYEYNDKGLCIKNTQIDLDYPNMKNVYEYSYDKHENEVGLHYIEYDGDDVTDEGWTVTEYTYDKQNRVTKQATKMSFDNVEWVNYDSYEYDYQENVTIERSYFGDGDLYYTATYTYDEKGNLINKKTICEDGSDDDCEEVYTVDKNGCTTKIESYKILEGGQRGDLVEVSEITYLNNLWYRPLKEITAHYVDGQIDSYTTDEREYDAKNRIKLYKIYDGTEEGTTPNYIYYATYEY